MNPINHSLIAKIEEAWLTLSPPFRISNSDEGEEPRLLAIAFQHKPVWHTLDAEFLDRAPDGYSSALSFFADEAFLYYIAAYMTADLRDELKQTDVVFALTFGLDHASRFQQVNPRRFGQQRWFDVKSAQHSLFAKEQVACVIDYLLDRSSEEEHEFDRERIEEAIANYWQPRLDWLIQVEQVRI